MTEFADNLLYIVFVWLVIIGLYGMSTSRNYGSGGYPV